MTGYGIHLVFIMKKKMQDRAYGLLRNQPTSFAIDNLILTGRAKEVFPSDRSVSRHDFTYQVDIENKLPKIYTLTLKDSDEVYALLDRLNNDQNVETAYVAPPRYLLHTRATGGSFTRGGKNIDWAMHAICMPEARKLPNFKPAKDVTVGIVDSGVDSQHPALGSVMVEENFTSDVGIDKTGHGSHVAGIIAAMPNQKDKFQGMTEAQLVSIKAITDPFDPGPYYQALARATDDCNIINLSLGGPGEDPTEELLINRALANNRVVISAMGNDYEFGNRTEYPAALDGVIAVGACNKNGVRANFSSTGPHIHLLAPGEEVYSTVPTYNTDIPKNTYYDTLEGTSMAVPFVSGAAALMLTQDFDQSPKDIKDKLKTNFCTGQFGYSEEFGHGVLDMEKTLEQYI